MVERRKPKEALSYKRLPRRQPITVADVLAKELHSTVFATENGRRIKTTKLKLLVKQIVNKAIAGSCCRAAGRAAHPAEFPPTIPSSAEPDAYLASDHGMISNPADGPSANQLG
jgi:hypothetical protein